MLNSEPLNVLPVRVTIRIPELLDLTRWKFVLRLFLLLQTVCADSEL